MMSNRKGLLFLIALPASAALFGHLAALVEAREIVRQVEEQTRTAVLVVAAQDHSSQGQSQKQRLPGSNYEFALEGGLESPGASGICRAEGNCDLQGNIVDYNYLGHRDPGNDWFNLGRFSLQNNNLRADESTPVEVRRQMALEADQIQLKRLQGYLEFFTQEAEQIGITLTKLELFNALDLANQSELAGTARDSHGFLRLLKKFRDKPESERILEARTWAYWSPQKNRWDAPGLGNTEGSIRRDQDRRMKAIATVLEE